MSFFRTKNILSRRWLNMIDGRVIDSQNVNQRLFQSHCFRPSFQSNRLIPSGINGYSLKLQQKYFSTSTEQDKPASQDKKKEELKQFIRLLQQEGGLDELESLLKAEDQEGDLEVQKEEEEEGDDDDDEDEDEDQDDEDADLTRKLTSAINGHIEYENVVWENLSDKEQRIFEKAFIRDIRLLKEVEFLEFLRACLNMKYEWRKNDDVRGEVFQKIVKLYGKKENKEESGLHHAVFYMGMSGLKMSDLVSEVWEILNQEYLRVSRLPEFQNLTEQNEDPDEFQGFIEPERVDLTTPSLRSTQTKESSREERAAFLIGFRAIRVSLDQEEDNFIA